MSRPALITTVLILFVSSQGFAQPQQGPPPATEPVAADDILARLEANALQGKESPEGVYVRDSAVALDKLSLAQRMERLKEWTKSADLYQEVVERYADRVVPSKTNEDDKIIQYSSVGRGVLEKLARWPKEGLDVYRARFEPTAASMVEAAGGLTGRNTDLAELHKVFYRYFVTETAKAVGMRLIDVNLERGEFQAAARIADELIAWHPNLDPATERPTLLYRAAIAHRLSGDEAKAKQRLETLQKKYPDAVGAVRGKEVKLAESLARELQSMTSLAESFAGVASGDSWPMPGGDPSRGRISAAGGRPGARLYRVALAKPQWPSQPAQNRGNFEQAYANAVASGHTSGVFPAVDRGELFFQDGTRIYGVSLESGMPLPGWSQTYPGTDERAGRFTLPNYVGSPRTHQLTVTLTDRAVLAVMGQADRFLFPTGIAPANTRLVCLDRRTGKENWTVALAGVELPKEIPDDQQKSLRMLQMNGSPLVVEGNVLVAARGVKQAQFEDCWVLCFNLATGKFRWSCYVASANAPGAQWGMQTSSLETTSHLAYANGRVYVTSNIGATAAIDAYNGTIAWLNIYERGVSPFDPNAGFNPFGNVPGGGGGGAGPMQIGVRPWVYNPVIVKDGNVFAMPAEGRNLFVYDANTGNEIKRVHRADFGNADTLLAVYGDRVVIAGEKKLFVINWKSYDADNGEAAVMWTSPDLPDGIRGRPFVTSDSIFVTTADRMFRFAVPVGGTPEELRAGRTGEFYPKYPRTWDEKEEGPGNVLVTGDHVVIAGATHVYGFTDLGLAKARLERDVALAPDDTSPRLRYAEIMFTAGEPTVAIAKLDEAIKLLGGIGAMRHGAGRDQIFNDAIAFAQKLASEERPEAQALTASLYERAAAAAASPQQQVHYRLSRARFAEQSKKAVEAVKLYQQILSEPELRPVALLDEKSGGPTQAAAVAEGAIARLIKQSGTGVYDAFEQAATRELAEAGAADANNQPARAQRLLEVAQRYPNAAVAPQATLAAADAYESAKNPRTAVQVLRQMYFKYPDAPQKVEILEAMARNYLVLSQRVDVAAARLAQGVALPGEHALAKPLRLPGGREIAKGTSFTAALEELRKLSGDAAARNLPDFRLPVPPKYPPAAERKQNPRWPFPQAGREQVADGVNALATPLRDYARPDRVVGWSSDGGGRVMLFAAGSIKPLGQSTDGALPGAPKGSAWLSDGVLVWDAASLVLLPQAGGAPVWRVQLKDLPGVDVIKPDGGQPPQPALPGQPQPGQPRVLGMGGRVVRGGNNQPFIMQNGQIRALPVPPGALNRPDPAAPETITDVRPVGDRVLAATTTGRLLSIDLSGGGRVAWQTRLTDRPIDRIAANEDFTVLKVSDETVVRLIAMDTFTGQIRGTRSFPVVGGVVPGNIALSADGTLVYTLPDRMVLKDLYKPWDASDRDVLAAAAAAAGGFNVAASPYVNAIGPDQLVIAEGRILALAEAAGPNESRAQLKKFVRVHSLETGQPITLRGKGGSMVDLNLSAGTDTWDVRLRVIGSRLYVINPRTVLCYNLDRPDEYWEGAIDDSDENNVPNIDDAFFGKQHVVLQSQPGSPERRKGVYQLLAYGRYSGKANDTAESGRLDYEPTIVEQQPVTAWQGVEGGFYYLTGDGRLHYLASATMGG